MSRGGLPDALIKHPRRLMTATTVQCLHHTVTATAMQKVDSRSAFIYTVPYMLRKPMYVHTVRQQESSSVHSSPQSLGSSLSAR